MLANELKIHQAWGACAPALLLLVATSLQQESENCPAASPLMALQSCASVVCWMASNWLGKHYISASNDEASLGLWSASKYINNLQNASVAELLLG